MIELRAEEVAQIALERDEYRKLLLGVVSRGSRADSGGLELICIGNAAGADSVVMGRPTGGFLLRCAGRVVVVDPGENSMACLAGLGVDPYSFTDVLASHAHDDHVGDLSAAVSAAMRLGLGEVPDCHVLVCPSLVDYRAASATRYGFTLPAFAWQAQVQALFCEDTETERFDGVRVRSQRSARLCQEIMVSATPARHGPIAVTGFVIDTPQGRLGYTADTEYFDGLADAYRGSAVLWINISSLGLGSREDIAGSAIAAPARVHGQLGYWGACQLIADVRPRTAFVSHLGAQLLDRRQAIEHLLQERFAASGTLVYCPANGECFGFKDCLSLPPTRKTCGA